MHKGKLMKPVLIIILSVTGLMSFAQSDKDVIINADRYFRQGQYAEAMPLYSQLLSLHRNDPLYAYRFGVSMLYSDRREPDLAIRYIQSGLDKLHGDDAVMMYYHLGTAYHLTFRFIEALRYYNMFAEAAKGKQYAGFNVEQRINMCNNGVRLLQNIRDLYVFERHHVYFENFFRSYNVSRFGGRLLVKPDIFKTKLDKKAGEQTIVFLSDTQQVVYYSSYGRDGKNGKDIYRSFKKADGNWDTPERLSHVVNSEYDEDYPFILPDGKTLYFSSKGHNSMGGYDIFRTTWDEEQDEWTMPVNLDFAINTPYDDILFVTDKEEKYAWFSSVRNSGLRQINVYLVRIDVRPEEKTDPLIAEVTNMSADVNDSTYIKGVSIVQNISNLSVNTRKDDFEDRETQRKKQLYSDNYKYNISENPTDEELINLTFKHAADAENSLQALRQKRRAVDMGTDNFRVKQQIYKTESDKLYQLAARQNDPVLVQFYVEKADSIKQNATEAGLMLSQSVDIARSLDISIDLQKKEYDKILMRAGDIQKLASARQIDTSLVLLKKLIDDIRNYEQNIDFQLVQLFPAPEYLPQYDVRINEKKNDIFKLNDSLNALQSEKGQLQMGLNQAKDPVIRQTLSEEMTLIDREVAQIGKRKDQLYDELTELNQEKYAAEQYVRSSEYAVVKEINTIDRHIRENPDVTFSDIADKEPSLKAVITDVENLIYADHQTAHSDQQEIQSQVKQDKETAKETDEIADGSQILSEKDVSSEDRKDSDLQKIQTDSKTESEILKEEPIKIQPGLKDSEPLVAHDDQFKKDLTVDEKQKQRILTSEEKRDIFDDIVASDMAVEMKTREISRMIEEERAMLFIQKTHIEKQISDLYDQIVLKQNNLEDVSSEIDDAGLSAWDRRMLQRTVSDLTKKIQDESVTLEQLFVMLEHTDQRIETVAKIEKDFGSEAEKIKKAVISGNENKADERFDKYSETFPDITRILFEDAAVIRLSMRKHADAIQQDAARMDELAEKSMMKASAMEEKSARAEYRSEKAGNSAKSQKLAEEKAEYDRLSAEYADSAAIYTQRSAQLKEYSSKLLENEVLLLNEYEQMQEISAQVKFDDEPFSEGSFSSSEISQMKQVIRNNLYTEMSSHKVSDAGQTQARSVDYDSGIPSQVKAIPNSGEKKNAITSIQNTDDLHELKKKAAAEHIYILRASATLLVSRIQQLENEIMFSTDPQAIARMTTEKSLLQEELAIVVKQHDRIASSYPETELLKPQVLPSYNEIMNDPDLALTAIEHAVSLLENDLRELQRTTNTAATPQEIRIIDDRISLINEEIIQYQLKAIEIIARTDRNKALASSIVIGSLPMPGADVNTLRRIEQLTDQQKFVTERMMQNMQNAEGMTSMEQKKILYLDIYEDINKDLELRKAGFELYNNDLPADTDINAIANRAIQSSVSDRRAAERYLAHVPSSELLEKIDTLGVLRDMNIVVVTEPDLLTQRDEIASTERPGEMVKADNSELKIGTDRDNMIVSDQREPVLRNVQSEQSVIVTERQSTEFVPFYSATNPIPEHIAPEGKLLFRVQFAASRRQAADDDYAGMMPLFWEQAEGWYRYMHGEFYQPEPAVNARNQIRTMGFADAFVVAYFNGKRINMAEARNIFASQQGSAETELATATTPGISAGAPENIIPFSNISGFYYAVQIGVYGSPRTSERLFGITPLIEDRMANGNYRYLTGTFASVDEAVTTRDRIRAAGVPDAFVVVYRNGVRINVAEARDFIAAGEKTTASQSGIQTGIDVSVSAERARRAANIYFKVQLGAFRNQVPVDVVNTFLAVAGEGIQILTDVQGLTIYLAGSFKTPAEAEALRNKVQTEGIPDAFIVAVEGDKKISMQEARELLGIK
jgi:hypothetical protein